MKSEFNFKRYEFKYMMNAEQYVKIRKLLSPYLHEDKYGYSSISSIYFDTEDYRLIRESLEKPVYKEKLRLRSYGVPGNDSEVFLEIKKKFDGIVYKRRIPLTLKEAEDYVLYGIKPAIPEKHRQIFHEIDYFISFYKPAPKLFLAYDRIALTDDKGLRVTFDENIRSRTTELSLKAGDNGELLLPAGTVLMEIKEGDAYPLWLVHIIEELGLVRTSFSKYGTYYRNGIMQRQTEELKVLCAAAE